MDNGMQPAPRPQREPSLFLGAALGALTSLPLIALFYLGAQLAALPFVPFDVFDWLARVLPGNVITQGIDAMVTVIQLLGLGPISATAKTIEQATGVAIVIAGGVLIGIGVIVGIRRTRWSGSQIGGILGALAFFVVAAIELNLNSANIGSMPVALLWLAIMIFGWARLLGAWLTRAELPVSRMAQSEDYRAERRAFLARVAGGSIGVAVVASGIAKWLELQQEASGAGQALSTLATPTPPVSGAPTLGVEPTPFANLTEQATLRDRLRPAPGTRSELTAIKDFYRIDIDTLPPVIDGTSWKLQVSGLFDRPRALTLSDLAGYPSVTQPITQGCISNPIGGDLIGTVNYTGARLRDLLKDLGMRPEARALAIKAVDGFYESVPQEELMDPRSLIVYGMNGETLTVDHGFPLRIFIPNHYGMKQPKWITAIEAINRDGPGYWVDRGWSATAYPQITAMIDTVAKDHIESNRVPIGGIAWAGDRGIRKVEVQVDNGEWAEVILRTPPLGPLTWIQWRYDWPVSPGRHLFRVRATDGTGALQTPVVQETYPDGATGYHSVTVNI